MLPRRAYLISGMSFLFIGFVILLNSLQGITGYVVLEDVDVKIGYLMALWFIATGIVILMAEYHDRNYNDIASKIYAKLSVRNAFGHHTEPIARVVKFVSGGNVEPRDVRRVLYDEIKAGRLRLSNGTSVSLPTNRGTLDAILSKYGSHIEDNARHRIEILSRGRYPEGVR